MATDDDDPKVKEVLGQTSEDDLARWFSLPSFQQVEEEKQADAAAPDPEREAIVSKRAKALENIDPELVKAIHLRTDENPIDLIYFKPNVEVHIDTNFGNIDQALIDKQLALAEPRIYELPPELQDELNECTPQALLRDLHRPEDTFEKQFEIADEEAERKIDVVAEIERAMTTSWKLPPFEKHPLIEARRVLTDLAADMNRPWTEYLPKLRNRRVQE